MRPEKGADSDERAERKWMIALKQRERALKSHPIACFLYEFAALDSETACLLAEP